MLAVADAFAKVIERDTALEDEVVAVFDLGEEQAVQIAGLLSLFPGKERSG